MKAVFTWRISAKPWGPGASFQTTTQMRKAKLPGPLKSNAYRSPVSRAAPRAAPAVGGKQAAGASRRLEDTSTGPFLMSIRIVDGKFLR